jgi:DNA-binding beta-propeller fold protein YncE
MKFKIPLLLSIACGVMQAQTSNAKGDLLVLSKGDHTLGIVDVKTNKVLARMPSGNDPHEVIASTDGTKAYISNYGGGAYNTLTVVDLVNHKTTGTIDLGALNGPHGLVFAGGKVWFTAEGAKAIGRFDPATQKIDWIMGTGQDRTHMLYVTPDLKQIYTSNVSSATITILEQKAGGGPGPGGPPRANGPGGPPPGGPGPGGPGQGGPPPGPRLQWEETVIPVGKGAEGFDVSPDGKELWAANAWDGTISVIDIPGERVKQTLAADVVGANRLKFTPDGKHVLVSIINGPNLTVLDTESKAVVKRIPIGHGAEGIEIEPTGGLAYVACTADDYIALIDLKTLEVSGHLDAGKQPDGMAWVR